MKKNYSSPPRQLLDEHNKANSANIEHSHEDYGYFFQFSTVGESKLLGKVEKKHELGQRA